MFLGLKLTFVCLRATLQWYQGSQSSLFWFFFLFASIQQNLFHDKNEPDLHITWLRQQKKVLRPALAKPQHSPQGDFEHGNRQHLYAGQKEQVLKISAITVQHPGRIPSSSWEELFVHIRHKYTHPPFLFHKGRFSSQRCSLALELNTLCFKSLPDKEPDGCTTASHYFSLSIELPSSPQELFLSPVLA